MKWLKFLIVFLIVFTTKNSFSLELNAQQQLFKQANQTYKDGNYKKSLELYEKLDTENVKSSSVYFNMGNLYLSFNQNTKALAFFIKAKKLAPFDNSISEAIEKTKANVDLDVSSLNSFFIWNDFLNLEQIIWLTFVFWIFICFFYLYTLIKKKSLLNKIFYTLTFINILLFATLTLKIVDSFFPKGIIITKSADLKTSFESTGISLKKLTEGSIVTVLEKTRDGIKIKNPDGLSGWVRNSSIVVIE